MASESGIGGDDFKNEFIKVQACSALRNRQTTFGAEAW